MVTAMSITCRGFVDQGQRAGRRVVRRAASRRVGRSCSTGSPTTTSSGSAARATINETVGLGGFAQAAAFALQTYQGGSPEAMIEMNLADVRHHGRRAHRLQDPVLRLPGHADRHRRPEGGRDRHHARCSTAAWPAAAAVRSAPASCALRSSASGPRPAPTPPATARSGKPARKPTARIGLRITAAAHDGLDLMLQWSDNRTMSDQGQLDALLSAMEAAGRPSSMSLPRPAGLRNFTELAAWLSGPGSGPAGQDRTIAGPSGPLPIRIYGPDRLSSSAAGPGAACRHVLPRRGMGSRRAGFARRAMP